MFEVMTANGLVHSRHKIRKFAEEEIQTEKDEAKKEIAVLENEIDSIQDFADTLTIKETE